MLSPLIFKMDGRALRVEKKQFYQTSFKDDTAYIFSKYNPYVYPYHGKVADLRDICSPGIYIYNKQVIVRRPINDEERKKYHIRNIIRLTPESIFENLDKKECIEFTPDIYACGENDIFLPVITPKDDIALAGTKFAIGKKKINFNSYGHKFSDQATKNNSRRAITHGTSLKMEMLSRYADVFDFGVALLFWDKKNCSNPMDPEYKKAYAIFDSEVVDLNKKNIEEISTENADSDVNYDEDNFDV